MQKVEVLGQNRYITIGKALSWLDRHICAAAGEEFTVRTTRAVVYVPSAVVLDEKYNRPRRISWSKRNILIRDKYICSYCGQRVDDRNGSATIDHIVSRAECRRRGTNPNTFENTCTSCKKCNTRKGDRSMKEAGMHFRPGFRPINPNHK